MTGRRRLTWVTALTVASLLVGSTALNALADGGRDGNRHGNGGQGNEHAQSVNSPSGHSGEHQGQGDDQDEHQHGMHTPTSTPTATTTPATATPTPTQTVTPTAKPTEVENDNDKDDLITTPVPVTGEQRPGLGCGDDNHEHMGPPGNPSAQCPVHNDDDQGENDNGGGGGDD